MDLVNRFIVNIGKCALWVFKTLSLGSGSTWPGHIALHLNPNFIRDITRKSPLKIILIAGTNGKTTTSTLIRFFLEKKGFNVFQNEEGANLLNGITSSLIKNASLSGSLSADFAIFEVDENTLPLVLKQVKPVAIVALNLFRDQLDRYGEVNTIARNWHESFKKLPEDVNLILNGDDPQISYLGTDTKANTYYFGLADDLMEKKAIPHDVDSIYCPNCGIKLVYHKMSYSHLGDFECKNCGFKREKVETYSKSQLLSPLKGLYNFYNISAAYLTTNLLLNIKKDKLHRLLNDFKPAFGRQEVIRYKNRDVFVLLSKNPTGFNQSIEAIKELSGKKNTIMLILNDRIPDGRDVSWIWDVEFQNVLPLVQNVVVSGDRTYDMALRLKYCYESNLSVLSQTNKYQFDKVTVIDSLPNAIEEAVHLTPENEMIYILATYSGMLDVRKLLIGKKLL